MCGIAGIVGHSLDDRQHAIGAMLSAQRHRGPDDEGSSHDDLATLGANRLSILDVSERGHMPISDDSGDTWIAFSGGLDSNLVASLAAKELGSVKNFAGAFEAGAASDERRRISVAKRVIPGEHRTVVITPEQWWSSVTLWFATFVDRDGFGYVAA